MAKQYEVYEKLKIAYEIGQQVTLELKSGVKLEGVIVEKLWETSCRVWLEPNEPNPAEDIDKAIVGIYAIYDVQFGTQED